MYQGEAFWTAVAEFTAALSQRALRWLVSQGDMLRIIPGESGRAGFMTRLAQTIASVDPLVVSGQSPASRTLGDMAYSIYLVHGLVLSVTFRWWLGPANAAAFSPAAHWALIVGGTPVLVLLCRASFLAIERPAMAWVASRR